MTETRSLHAEAADRGNPPDREARRRVLTDLETNLLVEAGAGSGKTTALVGRMVQLVRTGTAQVSEIAAVTFTRKAAGELRQRFQEGLETALAIPDPAPGDSAELPVEARRLGLDAAPTPAERARLRSALEGIDRAFMGTIHAFCARLLRERPLEARLDPGFQELTASEERMLARKFWNLHLERLANEGDEKLKAVQEVGLEGSELFDLYRNLIEASDVEFPTEDHPPPNATTTASVRAELERLLDRVGPLYPEQPPEKPNSFMRTTRKLRYHRIVYDWDRPADFYDALSELAGSRSQLRRTFKHWPAQHEDAIRSLCDAFNALIQETPENPDPPVRELLKQWRAHRYPVVLDFAQRAAGAFAEHRRRTGQLSFHDLLVLAADLLRRSPTARAGLGRRYRRLLVDEFQDTDPIQAELLFLLSSNRGEGPGEGATAGWLRATPRPGALFVVGDPKQSIYRFRRADIDLYEQVRRRFEDFGAVVELTTNFRSRAPIGEVVNEIFDHPERFPSGPSASADATGGAEPSDALRGQARFAPLRTLPPAEAPVRTGVYFYDIDESHTGNKGEVAAWDADALAHWIATRTRGPDADRGPGEFLVLTRTRAGLEAYARALEARGLPVAVSGAGVGVEEELRELRIVLEALAEPDDPVKVLAALRGLFFGLDMAQLAEWKEGAAARAGVTAGDSASSVWDFRGFEAGAGDEHPVGAALATLHRWWSRAREQPADLVVEEVVESQGLLAHAAGGPLGSIRAGSLAFALDTIRSAGLGGDTSLAGALEALDTVLDDVDTDVEAPLEPGRENAVRVMNLHKAKGLEAEVVVLAFPAGNPPTGRDLTVEREASGEVRGWTAVVKKGNRPWDRDILAAPPDWEERAAREERFGKAEEVRLLYVAATRAAEELVVARRTGKLGDSPWALFNDWLEERGTALNLTADPAPERERLEATPGEMAERVRATREERRRRGAESFGFDTVTGLVKRADPAMDSPDEDAGDGGSAGTASTRFHAGGPPLIEEASATGPGGMEWGSAVHAVLEAMARGLEGGALRAAARTVLHELDRPFEAGEPVELDALLETAARVRDSELWARSLGAEVRLAEQPFIVELDEGRFLEGVIDLAFREPDGWVLVDYKTDRPGPGRTERQEQYEAQVDMYGRAWEKLTGETVKERIVWWVR